MSREPANIARCPHCGTDFTPSHLSAEIERLKALKTPASRELLNSREPPPQSQFITGQPHRNLVYAWEGEVAELHAEVELLRAALNELWRELSYMDGDKAHRLCVICKDALEPSRGRQTTTPPNSKRRPMRYYP